MPRSRLHSTLGCLINSGERAAHMWCGHKEQRQPFSGAFTEPRRTHWVPVTCVERLNAAPPPFRDWEPVQRALPAALLPQAVSTFRQHPVCPLGVSRPWRPDSMWFSQAPVERCTTVFCNKEPRTHFCSVFCPLDRQLQKAVVTPDSFHRVLSAPGTVSGSHWAFHRHICKNDERRGSLGCLASRDRGLTVLEHRCSDGQRQASEGASSVSVGQQICSELPDFHRGHNKSKMISHFFCSL